MIIVRDFKARRGVPRQDESRHHGLGIGRLPWCGGVVLPAAAQQTTWRVPHLTEARLKGHLVVSKNTVLLPPCAEPSLLPLTTWPTAAKEPPLNPPPARPPRDRGHHVASTDLGFERGIGPAPGWGGDLAWTHLRGGQGNRQGRAPDLRRRQPLHHHHGRRRTRHWPQGDRQRRARAELVNATPVVAAACFRPGCR